MRRLRTKRPGHSEADRSNVSSVTKVSYTTATRELLASLTMRGTLPPIAKSVTDDGYISVTCGLPYGLPIWRR